jgi:excisionase family DNA binding protein
MADQLLTAADRLLTACEVAERLGFSTETVLRWHREGKLSSVSFGRAIRFHEDEIDRVSREGLEKEATPGRGASNHPGERRPSVSYLASNHPIVEED